MVVVVNGGGSGKGWSVDEKNYDRYLTLSSHVLEGYSSHFVCLFICRVTIETGTTKGSVRFYLGQKIFALCAETKTDAVSYYYAKNKRHFTLYLFRLGCCFS